MLMKAFRRRRPPCFFDCETAQILHNVSSAPHIVVWLEVLGPEKAESISDKSKPLFSLHKSSPGKSSFSVALLTKDNFPNRRIEQYLEFMTCLSALRTNENERFQRALILAYLY